MLDADGAILSHVAVDLLEGGIVTFTDVAEPEELLDYCFGRGGREVVLAMGEVVVEGRLETRWETSGRHWWLELKRFGG